MKPMLAASLDEMSAVRYPVLASPKLDGIRAIVKDNMLLSRKLKPIPNFFVQKSLGRSQFNGLDGELVCGRPHAEDAYRKTMSAVMSQEGLPTVTFWVFDNWQFGKTAKFHTRFKLLPERLEVTEIVTIRKLPHVLIYTEADLLDYEQRILAQGYEGVMLRDPHGEYKHGRSTLREGGLLKLKRFMDSEAVVINVVEEQRNDNPQSTSALGTSKRSSHKENKVPKGTVGALIVRDIVTGVEFRIGTGIDDQTAAEFWNNPPVGETIKYKYQPVGVKDKPRFPVFLGLRKD